MGSRWVPGQPKSPKLPPKSPKSTYFCSKLRQSAHSCSYYKIQNKNLGSVPPCISMFLGTIFAGRVPILQVSRFVAYRSNDSSCDPIRGHFGRLDSSRARLCGPAPTTRFKTKKTGSVPPCISMFFGTIFAGRVPILRVSRFVAFRSNDFKTWVGGIAKRKQFFWCKKTQKDMAERRPFFGAGYPVVIPYSASI